MASYDVVVIHVVSADKTSHQSGARLRQDDGSWSAYARAVHTLDTQSTVDTSVPAPRLSLPPSEASTPPAMPTPPPEKTPYTM